MTDAQILDWLQANAAAIFDHSHDQHPAALFSLDWRDSIGSLRRTTAPTLRECVQLAASGAPSIAVDTDLLPNWMAEITKAQ